MPEPTYLQWPVFRRSVVAAFQRSLTVRVTKKITDIPDRDDAAFCECAEWANADFLVTLNPGDFL